MVAAEWLSMLMSACEMSATAGPVEGDGGDGGGGDSGVAGGDRGVSPHTSLGALPSPHPMKLLPAASAPSTSSDKQQRTHTEHLKRLDLRGLLRNARSHCTLLGSPCC